MTRSIKDRLLDKDPDLRAAYDANAPKRELALALRALRKSVGLSQVELAERAGFTQPHVSKIEAASGPMPTTAVIQRYAAACNAKTRIEFVPADQCADERDNDYIAMAMLA
ncbi:MAG: helix-turn-helix domain-containing protein [Rhodobacteraceae bacterium]|jgi:transcriptional regulator with XRE-family HTH domain|nr:helix-turn-helix domain-containing protein [Paracoccaceae bacterium]